MKKAILTAVVLIGLVACKKDKEVTPDYLVQNNWMLVEKTQNQTSISVDSSIYNFENNGQLYINGVGRSYNRTESTVSFTDNLVEEEIKTFNVSANENNLTLSGEFNLRLIKR